MKHYSHLLRRGLMASACIVIMVSGQAQAQAAAPPAPQIPPAPQEKAPEVTNAPPAPAGQTPPAQDTQPAPAAAEIIVTASRVGRSGFVAPTPMTTLSAADINNTAVTNIADLLNRSPAFTASVTPASAGPQVTTTPGANFLNLRGLGPNRTLVLVDGQRHVPTSATGAIDINLIPSILIDRVDVVTGGASAAWGSDAVAGVVNFILDHKLNGLRANVQQGISQAGDDSQTLVQAAYGTSLLGGRLHLTVAGEYFRDGGAGLQGSRDWGRSGWNLISNPNATATNGQFVRLVTPGVQYSNATMGGLIVNRTGPLANIQFGPGGTVLPFTYGTNAGSAFMIGGSGTNLDPLVSLEPSMERYSGYGRAAFEITPHVTATFDATYARSEALQSTIPAADYGNITIQQDNAYLPAAVRAIMVANNITSFKMGRLNYDDLGRIQTDNVTTVQRYVGGLNGTVFDTIKWSGYFEHGIANYNQVYLNNRNQARWAAGVDAVVNPASGAIVCRSTLANPGNGCVPINVFGVGSVSQAAKDYVLANPSANTRIKEDAAGINISGDPFSLWAGKVSIAVGGEYRKQSLQTTTDPLFQTGGYRTGNIRAIAGGFNVKEIYGEAVVPLARDITLIRSLEFNGAVRRTDYSISGAVTSWKTGLSYTPINGIRFRAARSRDIRAPNITELFLAAQQSAGNTVFDPVTGQQTFYTQILTGNTSLKPEIGDTWTYGVVLEPRAVPGLRASIDAADIHLTNAISTLTAQDTVDRCFAGATTLCSQITRSPTGAITTVSLPYLNLASIRSRSVDAEIDYHLPMSHISSKLDGTLDLRFLATYIFKFETSDGVTTLDTAGQTDHPQYRQTVRITYDKGPLTVFVEDIFISKARAFAQYRGLDISDNNVPSANYVNLSASVRVPNSHFEIFGNVTNLFDKDPPIVVTGSVFGPETNASTYDTIGRRFAIGVRIR